MICPCGKKVKLEMIYGVRIYKHDDGTYCDMLNDFTITIDDIMNEYSKKYSEITYPLCPKQRMKQYRKMARIKDKEELKKEILEMDAKHHIYLEEMMGVFGRSFGYNLENIFPNMDLKTKFTDKSVFPLDKSKIAIEKLKLIKIDKAPTKVSDVLEKLRGRVNGIKSKLDKFNGWGSGLN